MTAAKNALVVGAGGGIGLALVRQLLADGEYDRVWCSARTANRELENLVDSTPRLFHVSMDFDDETTLADAASEIGSELSSLHLVVVATGLLHDQTGVSPEKRLERLDPDRLARYFATNTIGPMLVAKHFFHLLKHEERAVFAALSARVGSIGDNRAGGWYGYRASKAALNMFIKSLAIELGRRAPNVICASLHPGTVDTELSAPFSRNVPKDRLFSTPRAARQLLEVIGRLDKAQSGNFMAWDGAHIPW